MPDSVWSVKIEEEMKDRIGALIAESELSAKDFIAKLIESEEIRIVRKGLPNKESADTLHHHLKRAEEVFLEAFKTSGDLIGSHEDTITNLKIELQKTKSEVQERIAETDNRIKESQEAVTRAQGEIQKEMNTFKERAEKAEQIAGEIKTGSTRMEKEIDDLREQVKDLRQDRNIERKEKDKLQDENKTLLAAQTKQTAQISELQNKLTANEKAAVVVREEGRREAQKEANAMTAKLQSQIDRQQKELSDLHQAKDKLWEQLANSREQRAKLEKITISKKKK